MSQSVAEFELGLPAGWQVLPEPGGSQDWATDLAADVVADGGAADPTAAETVAQQLRDVRASVAAIGAVGGVQVAVFFGDATTPLVSAMMTAALVAEADEETYRAQLTRVAGEVVGAQVMGNQLFRSQVPAGEVVGAHFLIGHSPEAGDGELAHLEERVHAGVFLAGTDEMLDVMVVAANVGVFEDLTQTTVDLLENVTVRTEDMR